MQIRSVVGWIKKEIMYRDCDRFQLISLSGFGLDFTVSGSFLGIETEISVIER